MKRILSGVDLDSRRYGSSYREEVCLADGTRLLMRALGPDDAALLRRHFGHLSQQSRLRRFLGGKSGLSNAEVSFLTNPDGEMHVALVAVLAHAPHEALGVARFVRLAASPEVAEPALAVVDPMQGHGLGKLLIERLIEAARERGVERFRWVMLADNQPIRHLVEVLGLPVHSNLGSTITVEAALDRQRRSA
jgi:GNAT superfamily N-acetyltransferase